MTQKARPQSDIFNSGWTPQTVHAQINEESPNDASYVYSQDNSQGKTFVVKFPELAWPKKGTQQLTVRLRKTDSGDIPVLIRLVEGGRVIATRTVQPSLSYVNYVFELTDWEKDHITDYTNLRLSITTGSWVQVACCPGQSLPPILHVGVTNKTGDCTCFPDSFELYWNGSEVRWESEVLGCKADVWVLFCTGEDCSNFTFDSDICVSTSKNPDECSCDPFLLVFESVAMLGGCCTGNVNFTITE